MASPFDILASVAADALDAAFGEPVEITATRRPGGNPNMATEADPAHLPVTVMAIIGATAVRAGRGLQSAARIDGGIAAHASARRYASIDASGLEFAPEKGDRLRIVATDREYLIVEVRRGAHGRVQLDLAET